MRQTPVSKIRNVGTISHIDAGKTTTTERVLFYTGYTHRLGSVDDGTTVTDFMPQERERGITIQAAAITCEWRDHQVNLIDTPGHIDFTAEVQRSLRVLDGGVVVFDSVAGVEPQSETVWRQADRFDVPRICFINKMDRVGADFWRAIETISDRLDATPVAIQMPIGQESSFRGLIDLVKMRAVLYEDTDGTDQVLSDIPSELTAEASQRREQLIEKLADVNDEIDHGDEEHTTTHTVALEPSSQIHDWLGGEEIIVPSCHQQGIDRLGKNLVAVARTEDDLVEALERPKYPFLLAVQWHIERDMDQPFSRKIFEQLLKAAGSRNP